MEFTTAGTNEVVQPCATIFKEDETFISSHCSGRIDLIIGPMFSGKSTELLRRVRRYKYAGKNCLVLKYAKDKRYSENTVVTHDLTNSLPALNVSKLNEVSLDENKPYDVIGIDEGQFFPDLYEFTEKAANLGMVVILAALDGDFQRKPFGRICELVPKAESVTKLSAVCTSCKNNSASFTQRTTSDTAQEVIGGAEMYRPVCRKCFFQPQFKRALKPPVMESIIPQNQLSSPTQKTANNYSGNSNKENTPSSTSGTRVYEGI
eukprot:g3246.t1